MRILLSSLLVLFLSACTHVKYQHSQVLEQVPEVATLQNGINDAISKDVDLLSPTHFEEAQTKLEKAIRKAEKGLNADAQHIANEGLIHLKQANQVAQQGQDVFKTALTQRDRALKAHAHEIFPDKFENLDKLFVRAGRDLEKNKLQDFENENTRLAGYYADLQTKALKQQLENYAEGAYSEAKNAGADINAPKTLAKAKKELDLAKKVIEVEKTNYQSAEEHAKKAKYYALQAKGISLVVEEYKKSNLSREEMVLWYQKQLADIHSVLGYPLDFDKTNPEVLETFKDDISHINNYNKELIERGMLCEKNIAGLKSNISKDASEAEKARILAAQKDENIRSLHTLFDKNEAQVFLSGDDIIIRTHSLNFAVGKADVATKNYSLLNKVATAILRFPHSNIVVEGHTDSSGSKKLNMKLSKKRAENIARFLTDVGGIEKSRVTSIGYGDSHPVAKNDTESNRRKNRRVDVVIKRHK